LCARALHPIRVYIQCHSHGPTGARRLRRHFPLCAQAHPAPARPAPSSRDTELAVSVSLPMRPIQPAGHGPVRPPARSHSHAYLPSFRLRSRLCFLVCMASTCAAKGTSDPSLPIREDTHATPILPAAPGMEMSQRGLLRPGFLRAACCPSGPGRREREARRGCARAHRPRVWLP
jgi:hypothetical protein